MNLYTFDPSPPPAGYWLICGTLRIEVIEKPNWFHRKMAAYLLGWKWFDPD